MIFVEGIDQLEALQPRTYLKYWLPKSFPPRVKLIVSLTSTSSRAQSYFSDLGAKVIDVPFFHLQAEKAKRVFEHANPALFEEFGEEIKNEKQFERLQLKLQLLHWMVADRRPTENIREMLGTLN